MHSYLTDKKHRAKISNFIDLHISVSQRSILGPFLFNICDLFFFIEEENVTCYADDTTLFFNGDYIVTVIERMETKGKFFNWFSLNYLNANLYDSAFANFKRRCLYCN